jgi:hypothetical protein
MDPIELIHLAQTNARTQANRLDQQVPQLTNAPDAAKYEQIAEALADCASLLKDVDSRLTARRSDENPPTEESTP